MCVLCLDIWGFFTFFFIFKQAPPYQVSTFLFLTSNVMKGLQSPKKRRAVIVSETAGRLFVYFVYYYQILQ